MKITFHRTLSIVVVFLMFLGSLNAPAMAETETSNIAGESNQTLQDAWNVDFIGQIGGLTKAVNLQGDYAYVGEGL